MKEEKSMSPMFPRLHLHDTEKGGPKAPPRNKMALYEQFSVQASQRFTPGQSSVLPLPPNSATGSLIPSAYMSHGGGQERTIFGPSNNSNAQPNLPGKLHQYSSSEVNSYPSMMRLQSSNLTKTSGLADGWPQLGLNSLTSCKSLSFEKLSEKYMPVFSQSKMTNLNISQQNIGRDKSSSSRTSSLQLRTAGEKQMKRANTSEVNSMQHLRIPSQKDLESPQTHQLPRPIIISTTDNASEGTSSIAAAKDQSSMSFNRSLFNLNQESGSGLIDKINRLPVATAQKDKEKSLQDEMVLGDKILAESDKDQSLMTLKRKSIISPNQDNGSASIYEINRLCGAIAHMENEYLSDKRVLGGKILSESNKGVVKKNDIKMGSELFLRPSLVGDNKPSNGLNTPCKFYATKDRDGTQFGDFNRCNNRSTYSTRNSAPAFDLHPDDAVRVLGEKRFWKARSTIVNQQRVFAVQLFELHRLVQVQLKMAKSPHLLAESNILLIEQLEADYGPVAQKIVKTKNNSQKQNGTINNVDEIFIPELPVPSVRKETEQTIDQHSNQGITSGTVLAPSAPTLVKQPSWCFSPPGSQWLVPVMSPSEGLIYKPYTGPYPPAAGFMAPDYSSSSFGSMNLTGRTEDYPTAPFGVTPSLSHTYFPPYGLPVINSSMSNSKAEHMLPFPKPPSNACDNQFQMECINSTALHHGLWKMSSHLGSANSLTDMKFQGSKESELQGSSASSPFDKEKTDTLPLFPIAPTLDQDAWTHETQPIKVVPHNPTSASESAARIYKSIQEGRKQL